MEILYRDGDIVVCIKPARVLSTDEPGGLPDLLREALGEPNGDFRTVHRLDRVVSGVMVLARNAPAASELSRQVREGEFSKAYLAIIHGAPEENQGTFRDLLVRDKARRMTMVAFEPGKGVQEAVLDYTLLNRTEELSRVLIHLHTGRTHQIRVQFASRKLPLLGDGKYGSKDHWKEIALYSAALDFSHPRSGKALSFSRLPDGEKEPWAWFQLL